MTERVIPLKTADTPQGRLRKASNLSLRDLEIASGVNRGELSMWERGMLLLEPDKQAKVMAALDAAASASVA